MQSKDKALIRRLLFLLQGKQPDLNVKTKVLSNSTFSDFANCKFEDSNFSQEDRMYFKGKLDLAFVAFWEEVANLLVATAAKYDFQKMLAIIGTFVKHKKNHASQTGKILRLGKDATKGATMDACSGLIPLASRLSRAEASIVDSIQTIFLHNSQLEFKRLQQEAAQNVNNDQKKDCGFCIVNVLMCIVNHNGAIYDRKVLQVLTHNPAVLRACFAVDFPETPKIGLNMASLNAMDNLLAAVYNKLSSDENIPNATLIACLDALSTLNTSFADLNLSEKGIGSINAYVQLFNSRIHEVLPNTALNIKAIVLILKNFTDKLQRKIVATENLENLEINFWYAMKSYPDYNNWFKFSAAFDDLAEYDPDIPRHTPNIRTFTPALELFRLLSVTPDSDQEDCHIEPFHINPYRKAFCQLYG